MIYSIYTVDKFRGKIDEINDIRDLQLSNLHNKAEKLQSAYLQAIILENTWLGEGVDRGSLIRFDTIDVDLFLRFGPEDRLECILFFIESHAPTVNIPDEGEIVNKYLRVNNYLCINFDPTTSKHCKRVTKSRISEYSETICI